MIHFQYIYYQGEKRSNLFKYLRDISINYNIWTIFMLLFKETKWKKAMNQEHLNTGWIFDDMWSNC